MQLSVWLGCIHLRGHRWRQSDNAMEQSTNVSSLHDLYVHVSHNLVTRDIIITHLLAFLAGLAVGGKFAIWLIRRSDRP